MNEVAEKPTRDQEVRRLAEYFLSYMEPEDILEVNESILEVDESNELHGFDITAEEVAELMKLIIFQNETEKKIIDQERLRDAAIYRKLAEVPYRDWLAGMIFSSHTVNSKTAVECADKLIEELYPIEGEIK